MRIQLDELERWGELVDSVERYGFAAGGGGAGDVRGLGRPVPDVDQGHRPDQGSRDDEAEPSRL